MAGKIGACVGAGSMKSAKWRRRRKKTKRESAEKREKRVPAEEGDEGAAEGWRGGLLVGEGDFE